MFKRTGYSSSAHHVEIWTDGGCHPNPGPGGWGVLLVCDGHHLSLYGGVLGTTNNRMELTAAVEALSALKHPCHVTLYTDSQYVRNGVTRWHVSWAKKGWITSKGETVANKDLWEKLLDLEAEHSVDWRWVKGHSGSPQNEHVDQLATRGRLELTLGSR